MTATATTKSPSLLLAWGLLLAGTASAFPSAPPVAPAVGFRGRGGCAPFSASPSLASPPPASSAAALPRRRAGRPAGALLALPPSMPSGAANPSVEGSDAPSRVPEFLRPVRRERGGGWLVRLRRPFVRALAVLLLLLAGLSRSALSPAHAAWGKSEPVVVVAEPPKASLARKVLKLAVVAGAVAAGAATANRVGAVEGGGDADDDDSGESALDNVVPKDKPSPLPLSSEWIERELKEVKGGQSKPAQPSDRRPMAPPPRPSSAQKAEDPRKLVANLDSKIEMLRAREELAKADAEKKRIEGMEKAAEARQKEQEEIDAKIAAFEQQQIEEQRRVDRIREEKAQREAALREERLAGLERGRAEQARLEKREREARAGSGDERADGQAGAAGVIDNLGLVGQASKETNAEDVERMRRQPKSAEEEGTLQEKYGKMDLEERAFNILVDLGMVDVHEDPEPLDSDGADEEGAFM